MKLNAEQLRCLGSPIRARILAKIRVRGPMTVKLLCEGTELSLETTHYHVREMLGLGILRVQSTRISGKRHERLYEASADRFEFPDLDASISSLPLLSSAVSSILRLAAQDFDQTTRDIMASEENVLSSDRINSYVGRVTGKLSKNDLRELTQKLEELERWVLQRAAADIGQSFSLTAVLIPILRNEKVN